MHTGIDTRKKDTMDAVKMIRSAVKSAEKYADGTVVKFTYRSYTFAAIWISSTRKWYITASTTTSFWGKTVFSDDEFIEILSSAESTMVATTWEEV